MVQHPQSSQRYGWVDLYKGIGILLMVSGHIGVPHVFAHFYHAFHMPMFFFISGYLFDRRKYKNYSALDYMQKKFTSLLIPYLTFGVMCMLFAIFVQHEDPRTMARAVFWTNTLEFPISGALWFLTAIFISNVIFYYLNAYIDSQAIFTLFILFISTVGTFIRRVILLPFALGPGLVGVGLMFFGQCFRAFIESSEYVKNKRGGGYCICFTLIALLCIVLNSYVDMRTEQYGNAILFWIGAVSASGLLVLLTKCLEPRLSCMWIGKKIIWIARC